MSEVALERRPLPTGSIGRLANGYWGMVGLIATEAALFVYLEFSYYYYAVQPHEGPWPPDGFPDMRWSLPNTIVILVSAVTMWWGERGTRRGMRGEQLLGLLATVVLGLAFVALQGLEWEAKTFTLNSSPYGSLFFVISGFDMAHVVVGLFILIPVTLWSLLGYFGPARNTPVSVAAIYWYFVVAVWVSLFFMFYLTPRLGLIWSGSGT